MVIRSLRGRRALVAASLPVLLLAASACGLEKTENKAEQSNSSPAASSSAATSPAAAPAPADGGCAYTDAGTAAREVTKPPTDPEFPDSTDVVLRTNAGDITVGLLPQAAPCTVNSFLSLTEQGYFDDTVCHRVVVEGSGLLQCGDPSGTGYEGPGYTFADELTGDEEYTRGVVAMANSGADTNGSQFFLVFDDSFFPPGYTVFGTIEKSGLAVLDAVGKAGTVDPSGDGAPSKEIRIESASIS